jgi:hypothetical protein
MWKYIVVLLLLASCAEEPISPTTNNTCTCGEVTNINQYYPNTYFTYTIKNHCSGNSKQYDSTVYVDYGLDICLTKSW